MSIAGISSNLLLNSLSPKQASLQQFRDEFQQLGQDLQAGNLTAAQADYAQLQQIEQQKNSSASQSNITNSVSQLFDQLGKDLASGNVSSAQDDFNDIMKAVAEQRSVGASSSSSSSSSSWWGRGFFADFVCAN